jgi:pheromone a factor receptor
MGTTANSTIARRQQRMRRRLFRMSLGILVPYAPVMLALFGENIWWNYPWSTSFEFAAHHEPEHWNAILYITTDMVNAAEINFGYIPILTTVPIFWCFGVTREAINMYRLSFLAIGLGHLFPILKNEYDPDRGHSLTPSWIVQVSDRVRSRLGRSNK